MRGPWDACGVSFVSEILDKFSLIGHDSLRCSSQQYLDFNVSFTRVVLSMDFKILCADWQQEGLQLIECGNFGNWERFYVAGKN